jgi:hypothetical protein
MTYTHIHVVTELELIVDTDTPEDVSPMIAVTSGALSIYISGASKEQLITFANQITNYYNANSITTNSP